MNPDHLINGFRFYSETNTMQADLIRRKRKRGPARTGLYGDDLIFFSALRIFRMVTGLHPVECESSSLVTRSRSPYSERKSGSELQPNIYC